jgi:hypothetical protein
VLDVDVVYLPDGSTRPAPGLRHFGDIAQLAFDLKLGTTVSPGRTDEGVVVLTDAAAAQLDIHLTDLPSEGDSRSTAFASQHRNHPALLAALADGWATSSPRGEDPTIRGWTKLWPAAGGDGVFITFASLLPPAITAGGAGPESIGRRLGEFARLMGTSWHVSGHSIGLDLMRALRVKRAEEFVTHEVPRVARTMVDPDLDWCRPPSETFGEPSMQYVHAYDRGGSYLALGISGGGMFGVFLFLTYYLQRTLGYSPIETGLAFLPMLGAVMLTATMSTAVLLPRLGPRPLIPLPSTTVAPTRSPLVVWFS